MRILIVDDDLADRCTLQALLAGRGTIDTAATGRDAVSLFAASLDLGQPYDLVCLDFVSPATNGPSTLRALRALERSRGIAPGHAAKVLMTTGAADSGDGLEALRNLCEGLLVKPVDRRKLHESLYRIGLPAPEPAGSR
jgi:two-component system chemotaxis response regulator CheY